MSCTGASLYKFRFEYQKKNWNILQVKKEKRELELHRLIFMVYNFKFYHVTFVSSTDKSFQVIFKKMALLSKRFYQFFLTGFKFPKCIQREQMST